MKTKTSNILAVGAGVLLLMGATAGASVYFMGNNDQADNSIKVSSNETVANSQTSSSSQANCNDDNIVGKVIGGIGGGLIGNQVGGGSGKTAATIGGSVGGTLLGEEYIPTKNVTCR